jgi:hypothetical protein
MILLAAIRNLIELFAQSRTMALKARLLNFCATAISN